MPINLLSLDPDRVAAYTVWLDTDGKWHASEHWYAFLTPEMVYHDAQTMAERPEVVAAFAIKGSSRYMAIKKARSMLDAVSLAQEEKGDK